MIKSPADPITQYGGVGKEAPNAGWLIIGPDHPILGWTLVAVGIGFLAYCLWVISR